MAGLANSTEFARWTSALENLSVAKLAWAAVEREGQCQARKKVKRAFTAARSKLFSAPAPDLDAVIEKLMVWWGESVFDETYASSLHCKVIGDLRRIEMRAAGVDEVEAFGRSPEEATAEAEAWRSAFAAYVELEHEFFAGLNTSREADSYATLGALHHAAGELLQLTAPTIGGVIKKLEIIWEDDRFETIGDGSIYVHIMRDLNGLSRSEEPAAT